MQRLIHAEIAWDQIRAGVSLITWSRLASLSPHLRFLPANEQEFESPRGSQQLHPPFARPIAWMAFGIGGEYLAKGVCLLAGQKIARHVDVIAPPAYGDDVGGSALGQSHPGAQSWRKLDDKAKTHWSLSKDLLDMAAASPREFQVAHDLSASAGQANAYLTAASDLLWIYAQINAPLDKAAVRQYINMRLDAYSQLLELEIKQVNPALSFSASAGIATTETRLRDALPDGQSLLKSAEIR